MPVVPMTIISSVLLVVVSLLSSKPSALTLSRYFRTERAPTEYEVLAKTQSTAKHAKD
jgi:hypothetical protein